MSRRLGRCEELELQGSLILRLPDSLDFEIFYRFLNGANASAARWASLLIRIKSVP